MGLDGVRAFLFFFSFRGHLFLNLPCKTMGMHVVSLAGDTVQLMQKNYKSSDTGKRVASLNVTQAVVTGVKMNGSFLHSNIMKGVKVLAGDTPPSLFGFLEDDDVFMCV